MTIREANQLVAGASSSAGLPTKPRLKYAEVFKPLDFEHMANETILELDGAKVTFEGWHHGSVWVGYKGKVHFLKEGDPMIARLKVPLDR